MQCWNIARNFFHHSKFAAVSTGILEDFKLWKNAMLYCVPGVSKLRPENTFHMVYGLGSRLRCIRLAESCITLLFRSNNCFSLWKTFPLCFGCARSEYWHKCPWKGMFVL